MEPELLNFALGMASEWGENFHKPIQDRLRAAYPAVSPEEADSIENLCREIVRYAFEQIELAYHKEITTEAANADILARYPLIDANNMSMLWAQGQYYAWHG